MGQLEVRQDRHDGAIVVAAAGEVDTASVGELVTQLRQGRSCAAATGRRLLVVALGEVKYFGSAGLNAVLDCHEQGRAEGVTVRVVAANAEVRRPIEVTRLDEVLDLYDSVAAATDDRT